MRKYCNSLYVVLYCCKLSCMIFLQQLIDIMLIIFLLTTSWCRVLAVFHRTTCPLNLILMTEWEGYLLTGWLRLVSNIVVFYCSKYYTANIINFIMEWTGPLQVWIDAGDPLLNRQSDWQVLGDSTCDSEKTTIGRNHSSATCMQVWRSCCPSCRRSHCDFWQGLQ